MAALLDRWLGRVNPQEALRRGLDAMANGRQADAFAAFALAAKAGDPEAQYRVAQCYFDGTGVPMSRTEGVLWLHQAAEHGYADAQAMFGSLLVNGLATLPDKITGDLLFDPDRPGEPDFKEGLRWAEKASDQGSPKGDALLAFILSTGPEALRDPARAHQLYRRSAEAGCPEGSLGYALILSVAELDDAGRDELLTHLRRAAGAELSSAMYLLARFLEFDGASATDRDGPRQEAKNRDEAFELYRRAAERGIVAAQLRYGQALCAGELGEADPITGETWIRRAAQAGSVDAAFHLGELNARGGAQPANYTEAAKWYLVAAERGHAGAARALGSLYLTGAGVERDRDEATRWLKAAAHGGDTELQAEIGNAMLAGHDIGVDPTEVMRWFVKAASSGDLVAAFNIGICLANGVGVERDDRRAAAWIGRAAADVREAQYVYGRMLAEGKGVAQDPEAARDYFAKAAQRGLVDAEVALAEMMLNGRGGPKDVMSARLLFERAADKSHAGAMYALGMLDSGLEGQPEDPIRACQWFEAAASRGHRDAQFMAGHCALAGQGCAIDEERAADWFRQAARQGHEQARKELRVLAPFDDEIT
jgi:TPR repeat protein